MANYAFHPVGNAEKNIAVQLQINAFLLFLAHLLMHLCLPEIVNFVNVTIFIL